MEVNKKVETGEEKAKGLEGQIISSKWLDTEEEAKAKRLWKKQSEHIEVEINKIKTGKPGNITSIFKMREIVAGPKKPKQEAHAVLDATTGEIAVSNDEIKRVNLGIA